MQNIERVIIRRMIADLSAAGFVPVAFWDEEEYQIIAPDGTHATLRPLPKPLRTTLVTQLSADEALTMVDSVDCGTLHFAPADQLQAWGRYGVFLVLGNGEDVISDYHCGNEAFDNALQRTSKAIEEQQL